MVKPISYDTPMANSFYNLFKEHLGILLAQIAPDWDLHHMVMDRDTNIHTLEDEVRITCVLRVGKFRGAPKNASNLPRLD